MRKTLKELAKREGFDRLLFVASLGVVAIALGFLDFSAYRLPESPLRARQGVFAGKNFTASAFSNGVEFLGASRTIEKTFSGFESDMGVLKPALFPPDYSTTTEE
jgi:hypothetical protein